MLIDPNIFANGAPTGAIASEAIDELQKALTAGYGTDVSTLSGGGALRIQSLDAAMQSTIQENKHFRLFNKLPKPKAGATVDEWTEQSGVGGFLGGSTNTESGVIADTSGTYNRRVGMVKYLMTKRQVSFVMTLQNAIADAEAVEYGNGALQLLTDAEYLAFEGDSTVIPTEYDGIKAQLAAGVLAGQVDTANIQDARAQSLASINLVNQGAAQISKYGNFGVPTDMFCSQLVQSDFDTGLDPAFRVPLTDVPGGGIRLGSPVRGIRTSWGDVAMNPDVFIRDETMQVPFEVSFLAIAQAQVAIKPSAVTAVAAAGGTSSQWTAAQAGNYYYAVAGANASGQSQVVVPAQVAIAAGGVATITITASAGSLETGYVIYRSRLNGGNAVNGLPTVISDFREMARVPLTPGGTTVYVDNNQAIPGTSNAFILNLTPGATAITWRQLLPMLKFPLYPTNSPVIPWAQLLFGYLRISKRRHHVWIKNILTNGQTWKPFN